LGLAITLVSINKNINTTSVCASANEWVFEYSFVAMFYLQTKRVSQNPPYGILLGQQYKKTMFT